MTCKEGKICAREIRRTIVNTMAAGGRGHLPSALSLVEILQVLYDDILKIDPNRPDWPHRDRCILSKGHGCLALYAVLAHKGFFPHEALGSFCRYEALLGGHPEHTIPGVEASTGSLGHGLAMGIGRLLAGRLRGQDFRCFVVMGDGECNEGSVWEAALAAAKHKLDRLTVVIDANDRQSFGPTAEVLDMAPLRDKWRQFGFGTVEADGHDAEQLRAIFASLPLQPGRPTAIVCRTIKGKGIRIVENDPSWHHKSAFGPEDAARLLTELSD